MNYGYDDRVEVWGCMPLVAIRCTSVLTTALAISFHSPAAPGSASNRSAETLWVQLLLLQTPTDTIMRREKKSSFTPSLHV